MKKFLAGIVLATVGLAVSAIPAHATVDNSWHLKTDICHNGHIVPVSINATDDEQDTGHGLLILDNDEEVVSFVAHVDGNGHANDSVFRVYWKKGNSENNTWTADFDACPGPEGSQGPEGPAGPPGATPLVFCVPGEGLGFVFSEEDLPENAEILESGAVCPLAGADGVDGINGADGVDGADGNNGINGIDGLNGVDGIDGIDGVDGVDGQPGYSVCPDGSVVGMGVVPDCTSETTTTTTAPSSTPTGELPHTGLSSLVLAMLGAGVILAGLMLQMLKRRQSA